MLKFKPIKSLIFLMNIEEESLNKEFLTACLTNRLALAQQLLKKGADIHYENDKALRWTCDSETQLEMVDFLLQNHANINVSNYSVIKGAALAGYINLFKLLVKHGADITIDNYYVLNISATISNTKMLDYLINELHINDEILYRDEKVNKKVRQWLIENRALQLSNKLPNKNINTIIQKQKI